MKQKKQNALITVEAALILPIFLFCIYFFLYFFQVMAVQEGLHAYATKVGRDLSSYGVVANLLMKNENLKDDAVASTKDAVTAQDGGTLSNVFSDMDWSTYSGQIIDSIYLKERIRACDNALIERCVYGGYDGILFFGSSIFDEEECITIVMSYYIKLPMFQNILPSLPAVQQVRLRSFNGYAVPSRIVSEEEEETGEEVVYMTENGTVYHTNRNCSHLVLSIQSISSSKLATARNSNGAVYYACEHCFKAGDAIPATVYITKYGTKYHRNSNCSGLKRTIYTLKRSEVTGYPECKRCQSYDKKGGTQ